LPGEDIMKKILDFSLRHGVGGGFATIAAVLPLMVILGTKGVGAYAIMAVSEVIAAAYLLVAYFAPKSWRSAVDQGLEQSLVWFCAMLAAKAAQNTYVRVRSFHRRAFDPVIISQAGAVGRDLSCARPRAADRQSGASVARRQASAGKTDSDDGDGGDGEPPHLYTYNHVAQLLDCATKTIRNKVSAGIIPPPIKTEVGPRFTLAQVQALIDPQLLPQQPSPNRKRGRPRIAAHGGEARQ
jgi:hypothetical protein